MKLGEKTRLSLKLVRKGEKIMTLMLFWGQAVVDAALHFWVLVSQGRGAASAQEVQVFSVILFNSVKFAVLWW